MICIGIVLLVWLSWLFGVMYSMCGLWLVSLVLL